jgi:D-amino-acid oxidase
VCHSPRHARRARRYAERVKITVVGAGVIGLSTALALEEHGHDVRVVAAATDDAITSSIAGASWFPYRVGPPDRVAAWAAVTRAWLDPLAGNAEAGIERITGYDITADQSAVLPAPWWAAHIEVARAPAPVTGGPLAWQFQSARIEPARFLAWIAGRLRAPIERRAVTELAAESGDLVVNCTGLAARELAGDSAITALLGQVVITEVGGVDRSITITDDRTADAIFYLIPRYDELVLGGCSLPWPPGTAPAIDPAITQRILAQASARGLAVGAIKRVRAGLRPYRGEVRLERIGRIIHNYGHGGAGYTLCRGCAEEVARLA